VRRARPIAGQPAVIVKRNWDREVILGVGVLMLLVGVLLIIGIAVTL
jgi:hypothetical protein